MWLTRPSSGFDTAGLCVVIAWQKYSWSAMSGSMWLASPSSTRASMRPSARAANTLSKSAASAGRSCSKHCIAAGSASSCGVTLVATALTASCSVSSLLPSMAAMPSPSLRALCSSSRSRSAWVFESPNSVLASAVNTAGATMMATILNLSVWAQPDCEALRLGSVVGWVREAR